PLKSGKSTLMNAIAGSYVSEVSALPAYPCMVFVSHATQREFVLSRYDGSEERFDRPEALQRHVDQAHRELAGKLRQAEAAGSDFDPRTDFPRAIHKVRVKVPTEGLGHSSAVMVDTPGLYSRMKFGYGRMTRDFRNAAACAVFVVRSDNLFLEQVFAEFTDLLELFSRIFLVVNIDSRRVDLDPNGNLVPSLEQRDPQRIVEAFELLAMSEPLKRAAEDGRLRIYPIDLLEAGRQRLHGATKAEEQPRDSGFQAFFSDLTSYLDSTDHLVAFLGDSLRRASTLVGEISDLCDSAPVRGLHERLGKLQVEAAEAKTGLQAIAELQAFPFDAELARLRETLEESCQQIAVDMGDRTEREVEQAIRGWFRTGDSLQTLAKGELVPLFNQYQELLIEALSRELSDRLVRGGVGVEVPAAVEAALQRVGIDLPAIGREAHRQTDRRALVRVPPTPLRAEHFNVRRSVWDGLALRGQPALRQRLFGPLDNPVQPVSNDRKRTRLGEAGRVDAQAQLTQYRRGFFADTVSRVVKDFTQGYCDLVVRSLTAQIRDKATDLRNRSERASTEIARSQQLLEPLVQLGSQVKQTKAAVDGLTQHYGAVDLFLLTQPVRSEPPLPTKPRPRTGTPNGTGNGTPEVIERPGINATHQGAGKRP
ncbi:MAG: dynamin family protein, partial [Planctomycetes bacterium]|nr:dynamin family protein [Planctomycetota bacterium]